MAVIAAGGVAVIYVPQPIQTLVAEEFGVPIDASAAATTAVQAGYAVGIVLLVSLGDRFAARSQVTVQLIATAAALTGAASLRAYAFYVVMCFIAGATATIGQLLVAAALRLAPPEGRAPARRPCCSARSSSASSRFAPPSARSPNCSDGVALLR